MLPEIQEKMTRTYNVQRQPTTDHFPKCIALDDWQERHRHALPDKNQSFSCENPHPWRIDVRKLVLWKLGLEQLRLCPA